MAKNDNLKDLLTDVANAIRTKKGTTGLINPQDFSAEIASIETGGGEGGGGGAVAASAGAINFRDYDGTILHSYSKADFLALTELPPLPTQKGLTCQGWNYTLADAQSYVQVYGVLEVGATYITDDGKTRLYISVPKGRQDVPLYFSQTIENGVTIDWGDGSATETLYGSGNVNVNTTHHYNEIGDYVIRLDVADGCTLEFGNNSSAYCVLGSTGNNGRVYCNMLQRAEIGKGVTSIASYAFNYCYSLSSVVIPKDVKSIANYAFGSCSSLSSVVIPKDVTSIATHTFYSCYSLSSVVMPKGVTKIEGYAFNYCYSLSSVVIPKGVMGIANYTFYNCYSLSSVVIPKGVKSIANYAFSNCYGMAFYEFRAYKSVPSLSSTNAFTSIPSDCKIVVPDALYDKWIVATNWSTYASKIIKASEFNG